MARLVSKNVEISKRRVEDSTDGKEFVVAHNQTEQDIADIFGIKIDTTISQPIFGSVRSDGGINLLRFTLPDISSGVTDAVAIEFRDGVKTKRLAFVGSKIQVYTRNANGTWTAGLDYEDTTNEPTLLSKSDVYPGIGYQPDQILGVLANPDGDGKYYFAYFNKNALTDGYTDMLSMEDFDRTGGLYLGAGLITHPGPFAEGKILMVNSNLKFQLLEPAKSEVPGYYFRVSNPIQISPGNTEFMSGFQKIRPTSTAYEWPVKIEDHPLTDSKYSRMVMKKGVYNIRLRLLMHSRFSEHGYFNVKGMQFSRSNNRVLSSEFVVPNPVSLGSDLPITLGGHKFQYVAVDDLADLVVMVSLSETAKGAATVSCAIEIERSA